MIILFNNYYLNLFFNKIIFILIFYKLYIPNATRKTGKSEFIKKKIRIIFYYYFNYSPLDNLDQKFNCKLFE